MNNVITEKTITTSEKQNKNIKLKLRLRKVLL